MSIVYASPFKMRQEQMCSRIWLFVTKGKSSAHYYLIIHTDGWLRQSQDGFDNLLIDEENILSYNYLLVFQGVAFLWIQ